MSNLVSIITPFYNAQSYLAEAVNSVINQDYNNWELILVNDGSTDESERIIKTFNDSRILYFYQDNKGVSSARNLGLAKMSGSFFCFLDSDDTLTYNSLSSRISIFKTNPKIDFVDGVVRYFGGAVRADYTPKFKGRPLVRLLKLDRSCFLGSTWMIRRNSQIQYKFRENLTHSEDLIFYIDICKQSNGLYSFVSDVILNYRVSHGGAMENLKGLENGYLSLISIAREMRILTPFQFWKLKLRVVRIMFLSYLIDGENIGDAVLSGLRLLNR